MTPTAGKGWPRRWPTVLAWGLWALTLLSMPVVGWLDRLLLQADLAELTILGAANVPLLVAVVVAVAAAALGASQGVVLGAAGISMVLLPLATGAAILRYRLYELDRIVSRTVAYGLLTVLLGLGYAGVVLALGRLLPKGSSLGVAAATLTVAALFQPLRRRVQVAVDRRFNRRRHDAGQMIEAFGARLRDQVDLTTLTAELLSVVDQTMQPTRASLWLRPPAPSTTTASWLRP